MKTDAVDWPAGALTLTHAPGKALFDALVWGWRLSSSLTIRCCRRNDSNSLGRGGEPLRSNEPVGSLPEFAGLVRRRAILQATGGSRDVHVQETSEASDFPVIAEGQKIKKQDGKPIANTEDPDLAADVAERLNDDEARREEDKWSA